MEGDTDDTGVCQEDKYEIDGFVFNSKAEYYKYLIVSLLLIIAWVALLVFALIYPFEMGSNKL